MARSVRHRLAQESAYTQSSIIREIQNIEGVFNWQEKLTRWIKMERNPKFKAKPAQVVPIKELPSPWPEGPMRPEIAEALRKVKSKGLGA